jgi:predicted metal-dependent hydrolase
MRNLALLLLLLFFSSIIGCQFPDSKAKPVSINGLGSLALINNKKLSSEDYNKLLKEISKLKRVNEQDAQAMLEIFKQNTPFFSNTSHNTISDEKIADSRDIEHYLKLIMDYEQLRKPVEEIIYQEAKRMLMQRVDFLNPKNNAGSFVGQCMKAYLKAFSQTLETNKDKERMLDEQEGRTKDLINFLALETFEEKAQETVSNNQANKKEKETAKQFLENVEIYNESLPVNKKILDANGRLIEPDAQTTNGGQRVAMNSLAQGAIDYNNKPQAEEASRRIGNLVRPTAAEIRNEIKGAYKP